MKILIAGDWHSETHEEPVYRSFKKLGHETYRFSWHEYFEPRFASIRFVSTVEWFIRKFQNKFRIGPLITKINRDFIKKVDDCKPDAVFLYLGTHITRNSLRIIKKKHPATILIAYINDDPFSGGHPSWLWRHFLAAIPEYDMVLAYRRHNLEDFKKAGAKQVYLLRSWFIPECNHPVELSQQDRKRFECDVVFAGHYEADGREELLEEITRQGFRLKLFGTEWNRVVRKSSELCKYEPVKPVRGDEYNSD